MWCRGLVPGFRWGRPGLDSRRGLPEAGGAFRRHLAQWCLPAPALRPQRSGGMVGPPRWYLEDAAARARFHKTGKAPKPVIKGKKKDKKTKDKKPKPRPATKPPKNKARPRHRADMR